MLCVPDMQTINIGLRVLYRPDANNLATLIKQYGADYAERFLPSIGNEVCCSSAIACSQYVSIVTSCLR